MVGRHLMPEDLHLTQVHHHTPVDRRHMRAGRHRMRALRHTRVGAEDDDRPLCRL